MEGGGEPGVVASRTRDHDAQGSHDVVGATDGRGDGASPEAHLFRGGGVTFVATPVDDPSLPTYTGKFTVWGGFNANGKVVNGTFTFTVHGTGSDGSTFSVHDTDHFNTTPNGAEFAFTHCHN